MYQYKDYKKFLASPKGFDLFIEVRDIARELFKTREAITMGEVIGRVKSGGHDTWEMLACVDRMVERKELFEVSRSDVAGQYRTFLAGGAMRK